MVKGLRLQGELSIADILEELTLLVDALKTIHQAAENPSWISGEMDDTWYCIMQTASAVSIRPLTKLTSTNASPDKFTIGVYGCRKELQVLLEKYMSGNCSSQSPLQNLMDVYRAADNAIRTMDNLKSIGHLMLLRQETSAHTGYRSEDLKPDPILRGPLSVMPLNPIHDSARRMRIPITVPNQLRYFEGIRTLLKELCRNIIELGKDLLPYAKSFPFSAICEFDLLVAHKNNKFKRAWGLMDLYSPMNSERGLPKSTFKTLVLLPLNALAGQFFGDFVSLLDRLSQAERRFSLADFLTVFVLGHHFKVQTSLCRKALLSSSNIIIVNKVKPEGLRKTFLPERLSRQETVLKQLRRIQNLKTHYDGKVTLKTAQLLFVDEACRIDPTKDCWITPKPTILLPVDELVDDLLTVFMAAKLINKDLKINFGEESKPIECRFKDIDDLEIHLKNKAGEESSLIIAIRFIDEKADAHTCWTGFPEALPDVKTTEKPSIQMKDFLEKAENAVQEELLSSFEELTKNRPHATNNEVDMLCRQHYREVYPVFFNIHKKLTDQQCTGRCKRARRVLTRLARIQA